MMPLTSFLQRLFPGRGIAETGTKPKPTHYARVWRFAFALTAVVAIAPLVAISMVSYYQYRDAFQQELISPIHRLTSSVKRSMEFFLSERRSAMTFLIQDKSFAELANQDRLARVFRNLTEAFGGFVDLGLIDSAGVQRTYVGPYELRGMDYRGQAWFHEVRLRDVFVSDVFMGYRHFPHFVIAVKQDSPEGGFYVLRATIDIDILQQQLQLLELRPASDAFIINREGILQTPSRVGGNALERAYVAVPPFSTEVQVVQERDPKGRPYVAGYAYIEQSPFVFMLVKRPDELTDNWASLRNRLLGFLGASVVAILLFLASSSSYMVYRLREADRKQAKAMHQLEYSNKMASVGRLAAGVAHEINNPLAIINEKAGLIRDLLLRDQAGAPQKQKLIRHVDSVISSVERCSTITHRLLGFAKHIDVRLEAIDLPGLISEVFSFLEKEAAFRNITVAIDVPPNLPMIRSDRGQLQQVFLNIINNSFEALPSGGRIVITLHIRGPETVEITISDTGPGIPPDVLPHIFEPFFSTKKEYGTGLGLSITYGIIEKLGGRIEALSEVGRGTSFVITLPVTKS